MAGLVASPGAESGSRRSARSWACSVPRTRTARAGGRRPGRRAGCRSRGGGRGRPSHDRRRSEGAPARGGRPTRRRCRSGGRSGRRGGGSGRPRRAGSGGASPRARSTASPPATRTSGRRRGRSSAVGCQRSMSRLPDESGGYGRFSATIFFACQPFQTRWAKQARRMPARARDRRRKRRSTRRESTGPRAPSR